MIERCQGNLLDAEAEALVNAVNCVGIMGKGIALSFKKKFDNNFKAYEQACAHGLIVPGRMFIFPTGTLWNPRYIINFPTKRDWKSKSRIEDVETGLEALVEDIRTLGIRSIAVPPLGCGYGGLDWRIVAPMIERAFAGLPDVRVLLYEPTVPLAPLPTSRAKMTLGRAMLLSLMATKLRADGHYDVAEIHLMAFLIQKSGQPLRLSFQWPPSGPWAGNLGRVLWDMDGTFVRCNGDGPEGLQLLPEAISVAETFLQDHPTSQARLARMQALLNGFPDRRDMYLLGRLLRAAELNEAVRQVPEAAIDLITAQAPEGDRYTPQEVRDALEHLYEADWLG